MGLVVGSFIGGLISYSLGEPFGENDAALYAALGVSAIVFGLFLEGLGWLSNADES